jgi:hypothetical protein
LASEGLSISDLTFRRVLSISLGCGGRLIQWVVHEAISESE